MINATSDTKLKLVLRKHLAQTRKQVKRLEKIARDLDENINISSNQIIDAIFTKVGKTLKKNIQPSYLKDSAIIAQSRIIKHYEIALYNSLTGWAKIMVLQYEEELLTASLDEEKETDEKFREIAEGSMLLVGINAMVYDHG